MERILHMCVNPGVMCMLYHSAFRRTTVHILRQGRFEAAVYSVKCMPATQGPRPTLPLAADS